MATIGSLIKASLRKIGVVDHNQEPDATMYAIGLESVNRMLYYWATVPDGVYQKTEESFSMVAADYTYTIGQSGTPQVNSLRPMLIEQAWIRYTEGNDEQLNIVAETTYNAIFDKDVAGDPEYLCYKPSYPNGTILLYPAPTTTETVFIRSHKPLAQYTATANDLNLPPEYEPAIEWNLAAYIATEFGVEPPATVVAMAKQTLDGVKRVHTKPRPTISSNPIGGGERFNIYRG